MLPVVQSSLVLRFVKVSGLDLWAGCQKPGVLDEVRLLT